MNLPSGAAIEVPRHRSPQVYANTTWELITDPRGDTELLIQRVYGVENATPSLLKGANIRIGGIAYHVTGRNERFFVEQKMHVFESTLERGFVPLPPNWSCIGRLEPEPTTQLWYIVQKGTNIRVTEADVHPSIYSDFDAARAAASSWDDPHVPMLVSEYHTKFGEFMDADVSGKMCGYVGVED